MTILDLGILTIVVCLLVLIGLGVMVTITVRRTLRDLAHDVAGSTRNNEWNRGFESGLREGAEKVEHDAKLTYGQAVVDSINAGRFPADDEHLDALLGQMFPESPSTQDDYRAAVREAIREYDRNAQHVSSGAMLTIAQRHAVQPVRLRKIASSVLGARS
jgi:hypothetical protein